MLVARITPILVLALLAPAAIAQSSEPVAMGSGDECMLYMMKDGKPLYSLACFHYDAVVSTFCAVDEIAPSCVSTGTHHVEDVALALEKVFDTYVCLLYHHPLDCV